MKKAFWNKVAAEGIAMTGRYMYEYDQKKKAIHVTDSKGVVDKWVTLADCEPDATPATTPATPAPKQKKSAPTPAPQQETITLTKADLAAIIENAVQSALATAAPAPIPKATPAPKKAAKAKSVKPLADHSDKKLSKDGKKVLKAVQEWAKRTRHAVNIEVNGSWIWLSGTEKSDREVFKNMGFRWRQSRQMWSWDDTRVKSA